MILKLTGILALWVTILTCSSLEWPFDFRSPGTINFAGGVLQPMTSNLQYDPGEPDTRQQLTIDERIEGTRSAPAGGFGLTQSWRF
jgi:hypothetical protein